MPIRKYVPLIVTMSAKDAFWILIFYGISVSLFGHTNILESRGAILTFILLTLIFAFVDEIISTKQKRWEYTHEMPTFFGVGITPLLELSITGMFTFYILFSVI